MRKKDYIWNPSRCTCENGKCFESIVGYAVIICDEFIGVVKTIPIKTIPTSFNGKK